MAHLADVEAHKALSVVRMEEDTWVVNKQRKDMKIIEGLERREVCGESILVPIGEKSVDFSKLISLNETSLFLWKRMEGGEFTSAELVKALLAEYEIDEATASKDVDAFIEQLLKEKLIVR